tara:strand:+ start:927 stop:1154 length:228 start_codon:yes stop_codon:yes gene_type:complete
MKAKNKYHVKYRESYKWATVLETFEVTASSEEEARQLVDEGNGKLIGKPIVESLCNHKESDFIDAEYISPSKSKA